EGLVLAVINLGNPHRTAGGEGELVVARVGNRAVGGSGGEGRGVGGGIALIPERAAVKLVGAALGGGVDDAAAGASVLGGEGVGLDGELLHRLRRETDHRARHADSGIVDAIGHDHAATGASAVHAEIEVRDRAARAHTGIFGTD